MLAEAAGYGPEPEGRFVVFTRLEGRDWEVIVEPDSADRVLLVITAYRRD